MPANLFSELDNMTSATMETDNRAFNLALELTMLRLNDPDISPTTSLPESLNLSSEPDSPLGLNGSPHLPSFLQESAEDLRNKKSANMTECVPVPSSEHVAEIVGRQGCKIKALRAKTNTYIKTPVRGEEPVFVVTGRKEDVARAKREILSAADHFSALRASRKSGALSPLSPPTGVPGHVTIEVRVPYKVVGLVVGPKGATIKRIQHQTNTYIVTPSRDKEPVFEMNHHVFSGSSGCSSASSSSSSSACAPHSSTQLDLGSIWSGMSSLDKDEGLGDSPSFDASPVNPSSIWSYPPVSSTSPSGSISGSRQCYLCNDREVTHALIPCGHNFFCSECAERTCDFDRTCPMCRVPVNQAMRIIFNQFLFGKLWEPVAMNQNTNQDMN
ncbi:RNA-binding protein MEX3D-like [Diaphorina citri]|uniref:RNA-binding protein MEX3D-like n=1 Tax=Diaphorina citri TaxID=121845 RepID=A0A1S3DVD9_DIACI|nr:RNA-binding protein MEX3D-like [Diaphorina citri]